MAMGAKASTPSYRAWGRHHPLRTGWAGPHVRIGPGTSAHISGRSRQAQAQCQEGSRGLASRRHHGEALSIAESHIHEGQRTRRHSMDQPERMKSRGSGAHREPGPVSRIFRLVIATAAAVAMVGAIGLLGPSGVAAAAGPATCGGTLASPQPLAEAPIPLSLLTACAPSTVDRSLSAEM